MVGMVTPVHTLSLGFFGSRGDMGWGEVEERGMHDDEPRTVWNVGIDGVLGIVG